MKYRALRWALIAALLMLAAWIAAYILLDDISVRLKVVLFLLLSGDGALILSYVFYDDDRED